MPVEWQGRGPWAVGRCALPGFQLVELPKVLGPCLPGHEERRRAVVETAMPERRLTRLQVWVEVCGRGKHRRWRSIWRTWPRQEALASAQWLAEVHKPSHVYGDHLCPAVLAVTVPWLRYPRCVSCKQRGACLSKALRLALYGWGSPPAACEAQLLKVQVGRCLLLD